MYDAFSVKKIIDVDLTLLLTCRAFFRRGEVGWSLPLRRLLLSLSVIPKHPKFLTRNDVGDKLRVVFGLFLELSTDRNAVFSLITAQQP